MIKCNHKMKNGDTSLVFDEDMAHFEYPRKYRVKCFLCEQGFTIKKLPPELSRRLVKINENISI